MTDQLLTNQPITLDDVVFAEASHSQRNSAWELNGEAWAGPMGIADYVAREAYLSQQELSRGGRCRYWVLTLKSDDTQIVASCETTRKDVLIADSDGFRTATGYGIASVYTNPRFRRLGMAAYLMRRVQEVIDESGECSSLYSDIGKIYYQELGWPVFPSAQVTIHLLTGQGDTIPPAHPGRTRYLTKEELPSLCDRDVADLVNRFEDLAADGRDHVAFRPSWPQISWQLAREEFMARVLFSKEIHRWGAITAEERSWIYWEHDWRAKELKILRIVTPEPTSEDQRVEDILVLLDAALAEAAEWGFEQVLVWNPDEALTLGAKGVGNAHEREVTVIFDERLESSIPSFRWKGGKDTRNTVWEENLYYCWC